MELHRTDGAFGDTVPFRWQVHAAGEFDGDLRTMITDLKYAFDRSMALPLARILEPLVRDLVTAHTIVTWIPTTESHRRERGHDHAELVARHVSALTGSRVLRLLRREGEATQTGHGREHRLRGPAFVARPMRSSHDVIVIDDVTTTGATFRNAALALQAHRSVVCVAVAWVP